jgi:hypothetical protein
MLPTWPVIEVGLLLEKVADELGVLLQTVLDVNFLGSLAGEGSDFIYKDEFKVCKQPLALGIRTLTLT